MKKLLLPLGIVLLSVAATQAQDNSPLTIGGELLSKNRIRLNDSLPWSWNENRLDLQLTRKIEGYGKFNADVWFRSFNFSPADMTNPFYTSNITLPFSYEIREANFELYDFLVKNLDITIGRQRIAWGTADGINPTDNLNPYDLSDIWDFGNHLGSDALDLRYYIKDFKIEGVFLPYFTPARMPFGDWWQAFDSGQPLPDTMVITETHNLLPPITVQLQYNPTTYHYLYPPNRFSETPGYGFKLAGHLFGFDLSASYMYGHDGLPLPYQTDITIDSTSSTLDTAYLSVSNTLIYPHINIFGFDFAGTLGNIGVRGELGIFVPDKQYTLTVNAPDPNEMVNSSLLQFEAEGIPEDSVVLDKKPYARYVLGADYIFSNGYYLNVQYIHGFINERGQGNLNNYLSVHFEMKFFDEKLLIAPADIFAAIYDWNHPSENYAYVYMPSVTYQATDNARIEIGTRIIDGEGNGLFANIKDKDQIYIKAQYSF